MGAGMDKTVEETIAGGWQRRGETMAPIAAFLPACDVVLRCVDTTGPGTNMVVNGLPVILNYPEAHIAGMVQGLAIVLYRN